MPFKNPVECNSENCQLCTSDQFNYCRIHIMGGDPTQVKDPFIARSELHDKALKAHQEIVAATRTEYR